MFSWKIARRYLSFRHRHSFISLISVVSIGGVFLGTMAMIIALSILNGFENEVRTRIVGVFAHIKVLRFHNELMENPDSVAAVVSRIPGVVSTTPFIMDKVGVASKQVRDGILLIGIDPAGQNAVTGFSGNVTRGSATLEITESNRRRANPGVVLGATLADYLRVEVGDEVNLVSLRGADVDYLAGITPVMRRFTVTGIYESGLNDYDGSLAFVEISAAQKLLDIKQGVTGLEVRTTDIFGAPALRAQISDTLGYPYYAMDWIQQNKNLFSWMKLEKLITFSVICLIVLVAAFNIISSLIMTVMEKTREIGILKTMGARNAGIMQVFILTGTIVGVIGTIGGTLAGLFLCWLQYRYHLIPLPSDIYFIPALPIKIEWLDVVAIDAAAILLCFLATLFPAWQAAKLHPSESIKFEH